MQVPSNIIDYLDERLLDLCTSKDGDLFLTVDGYNQWLATRSLYHVARVRVIQDIVARASNDLHCSNYRELAYHFGLSLI